MWQQAFFWALCLCEIAVILAGTVPSHWISNRIITMLVTPQSNMDTLSTISELQIHYPFLIGWFMNLVGSIVRLRCYRLLDRLFTFELSIRKNHNLITSGPYSIVRHSSYTGAILSMTGVALWHFSPGSWLVECSGLISDVSTAVYGAVILWIAIVTVTLGPRMNKEDEMLKRTFGKEWEEWAERVPYRLVPGIY